MSFTITFIGRPNVGKSSLFNILLKRTRSIVLDMPGTTLDTIVEKTRIDNHEFSFVDCQGLLAEGDEPVMDQLLRRSDGVLFVVDAQVGPTPFDRWIATELKASAKPVLLVINKSEQMSEGMPTADFAELGFGTAVEVSAAHKRNMSAIAEWCVKHFPSEAPPEVQEEALQIALIGRPNSGKSTLMNRLCQETVSRVSPIPHTTRDPVSFHLMTRQGPVRFVDTAGMRRPRAEKQSVEVCSVKASTNALKDADVVCLMIPSHEDVADQDMRLLSLIEKEGRPMIILLNFWDRLDRETRERFLRNSEFFRILKKYTVLKISGKTGYGLSSILPLAFKLHRKAQLRIPTARLNRAVEEMVRRNPPPTIGRGNFNILYASQVAVQPPTFVFFMNRKEALPTAYRRYVENSLKDAFDLTGQPMRLLFRSRDDR